MIGFFESGHVGFESIQDEDVLSFQRDLRLSLSIGQPTPSPKASRMKKNRQCHKGILLIRRASGITNSVVHSGHFTHFYLTGLKKTSLVF